MGRAPNQGVPQRVSAHVVPKTSFEEEKTTLESGWEDEGSTTIEQGEIADKVRALGLDPYRHRNPGTQTNEKSLAGEPTHDDQLAHPGASIITPPMLMARLVVTHGSDRGQEIEVVPGKNYSIGRAIDNDVVLTDIAVSRKHIDLRFENNRWIVADRGSGNGTLINGNLEDAPFVLANGDAIEIGNTTFRFDAPNAPARNAFSGPQPTTNGFGGEPTRDEGPRPRFESVMDEEPSTVAGKPVRDSNPPQPFTSPEPRPRPKTVPPPPPRGRNSSAPPPLAMGGVGPPAPIQSMAPRAPAMAPTMMAPAPIAPMPVAPLPMAPPLAQPLAATMMAPPPAPLPMAPPGMAPGSAPSLPQLLHANAAPMMLGNPHQPGMLPTTIPGQGPPIAPMPPHVQALPFTYPNVNDHVQHIQNARIVSNGIGRDATATAHVPPTPYGPQPMAMAPSRRSARRVKLLLAGAGLAIVAAIATAAIIKAVADDDSPTDDTSEQPQASDDSTPPIVTPLKQEATPKQPASGDDAAAKEAAAKEAAAKEAAAKEAAAKETAAKETAAKEAAAKEAAAKEAAAKEAAAKETAAKEAAAKEAAAKEAAAKEAAAKEAAAKEAAAKEAAAKEAAAKEAAAKEAAAKEAAAAKKAGDAAKARNEANKNNKAAAKRVAAAEIAEAKTSATTLYRSRKFFEAASVLRAAASKTSGTEANQLKTTAGSYEQFARYFTVGMASQTKAAEAWSRLTYAQRLDDGTFRSDIEARLNQIASSAAAAFLANENFPQALAAARRAEANGSKSTMQIVRQRIDEYVADLYDEAKQSLDSSPKEAKDKLKRIKTLVDAGSNWARRADDLLAKL